MDESIRARRIFSPLVKRIGLLDGYLWFVYSFWDEIEKNIKDLLTVVTLPRIRVGLYYIHFLLNMQSIQHLVVHSSFFRKSYLTKQNRKVQLF